MKIERTRRTPATRRAAATGYARAAENVTPLRPTDAVVANIFGIPDAEFTPSVQGAVMKLMGEADALRTELQQMRMRLEQVEQTADQDQLLPILNRRAFTRELTRHIAVATRYATPSSLIYFDLDGFKAINDTYGHTVGDHALREVAAALLSALRPYDLCVRYAGDEFIIVLSDCSREMAEEKRRELQQRVTDIRMEVRAGKLLELAASAGASVYPADGVTYESLLADADHRMYRDKTARSNRVALAARAPRPAFLSAEFAGTPHAAAEAPVPQPLS
jgi:diguanylate cyclase (GGDEF)-like protein